MGFPFPVVVFKFRYNKRNIYVWYQGSSIVGDGKDLAWVLAVHGDNKFRLESRGECAANADILMALQ